MTAEECKDQEDVLTKRVEEVVKALEERLRSSPIRQPELSGWKKAGVILAVLTAIATPVLTMTWYVSTSSSKLDGLRDDVESIKNDMYFMRQDIQRLRERIIIHTQEPLPLPRDTDRTSALAPFFVRASEPDPFTGKMTQAYIFRP